MTNSNNAAQMQMSHKTNSCRTIKSESKQQQEPQLRPSLRFDHELRHSFDIMSHVAGMLQQ